ncbi:MAG: hypothetical protein GY935_20180 [Gammaproteobacteria bacterium]|nr:hypothetical protein [Gammaproteobacteria bacterium]
MKHLESQLRLGTGLILALYVVQHLINHAFGIVSTVTSFLIRVLIRLATIHVVFRVSRKRQIKAPLAAKTQGIRCTHGAGSGYSPGNSCNAEMTLSRGP